MHFSVDFGGSTIDLVEWEGGVIKEIKSYERFPDNSDAGMDFIKSRLEGYRGSEVYVTGGRSRFINDKAGNKSIIRVPEIEAIGIGGMYYISHRPDANVLADEGKVLVVSMGTGTCMVELIFNKGKYLESRHVGGTGVGGGTFVGLSKVLLNVIDIIELKKMFTRGDLNKVDLSVLDVVGEGIGVVPAAATAANLAKLAREVDFSKADLAAGIANLIGQTIGITATFAAKANKIDLILLTGKLTAVEEITQIIVETGAIYGVKMIIPEKAEYVSAVGAGYRKYLLS